jgi:hypothetical protein
LSPRANQFASLAAVSGAMLLFAGTYLHPMSADPNATLAALTEYAADHYWVASHLMQLGGIILMSAALLQVSWSMAANPPNPAHSANPAAGLAAAGAVASLAVAGVLQAVDGVALKAIVNAWAAAPEGHKESLFQASFAVRQIEIGLASVSALLFGLTVCVFGVALVADPLFPKWLGFMAIAGGAPTAIAGVAIACTGFSALAMAIDMPSGGLLLCWMATLGIHLWRRPAL